MSILINQSSFDQLNNTLLSLSGIKILCFANSKYDADKILGRVRMGVKGMDNVLQMDARSIILKNNAKFTVIPWADFQHSTCGERCSLVFFEEKVANSLTEEEYRTIALPLMSFRWGLSSPIFPQGIYKFSFNESRN